MVDSSKRKGPGEAQHETTVKRQRVSRACDQCRAAREKCDGIQPMCFTCVSSNRPCSYTTPPKKRGIQPGYIRTLELTLAWLFQNVSESESALRTALSQDQVATTVTSKDSEASARLHKVWRKSASCHELERLLGSFKPDVELETEDATDEAVHSSDVATAGTKTTSGSFETLDRVALPHDHWRLLDIYFAYTHAWFPVLQKHEMLRLSYTYGEDGIDLRKEQGAQHAELWALFAVAVIQYEASTALPSSQRKSVMIYNLARRLIPDENSVHAVGHANALLLLVFVNIGAGKWTAAWLLLGQAISIAIDLGLHKANPVEPSRNKLTVLACFFLEVLLCAYLDRAPRLSSIDIAALGPVDEEGLEEWHPWSACEGFVACDSGHDDAMQPTARAPSHSLSILNQLVMLSNAMRTGRVPPLSSLPYHLRDSSSLLRTPQLLHLHICHACCVSDIVYAQDLLEKYTHHFGSTTMPTVFMIYISLLLNRISPKAEKSVLEALEHVYNSVAKTWSMDSTVQSERRNESQAQRSDRMPLKADTYTIQASTVVPETSSEPSIAETPTVEVPLQMRLGHENALMAHGLGSWSTEKDLQTPNANIAVSSEQVFSPQKLRSQGSIDVDALFDELASLDYIEDAGYHPMFMQNLGIAPSTDLNDVLGLDFGFEPLLSTYTSKDPSTADPGRTTINDIGK